MRCLIGNNLVIVCIAFATVCCIGQLSTGALTFVVKLSPIKEFGESLTLLRKLSPPEPLQNRCTRITALLLQHYKQNPVEIGLISRIAQDDIEVLSKMSRQANTQLLAKVLFAGLDSYITTVPLDRAYLDLVECIRFTFQGLSPQAIRDLNQDRYLKPASQLQAILSQKAAFLIDPNFQHPTLKLDELDEPIQRTLLSWFNGDHKAMESHFISHESHSASTMESNVDKVYTALESAYGQMTGRWKKENKCKIYGSYAKWGSGKLNREQADRELDNMQTNIENSHKFAPSNTNEADTMELITLIRASHNSQTYHPILIELIDCLTSVYADQGEAIKFLKSTELTNLIDEMESSFAESERAAAEKPIDQKVASVAEPNEQDDDDEEEEEDSDYEPDSDDEDSDDEDGEDGEEGEEEGQDGEEGEGDDEDGQEEGQEGDQDEEGDEEEDEEEEEEEEEEEADKVEDKKKNVPRKN